MPIAGPAVDPHNFKHERWTQEEGAPSNISALAQTSDGFLWLGTPSGLWRFDGITFEQIPAPEGSPMANAAVTALHASRNGTLWIGYSRKGGVAVYRQGRIVDTRMPHPPRIITNLIETKDAMLAEWGGLTQRLWRWDGRRWAEIDQGLGIAPGFILRIVETRDGSLWFPLLRPDQQSATIFQLPPGATRVRERDGRFVSPRLTVDPNDNLWVADQGSFRRYRTADDRPPSADLPYPVPKLPRNPTFVFDQWGGAWGISGQAGSVFRIQNVAHPAPDPARQIAQVAALSDAPGMRLISALVDRDGSIWFSGENGLERFRFASVMRDPVIPADTIGGIKIARTSDGSVYASSGGAFYRIRPTMPAQRIASGEEALAICSADNGALWFMSHNRLSRLGADGSIDRLGPLPTYPSTCVQDRAGRLWVHGMSNDIWWRERDRWHRLSGLPIVNAGGFVNLAANDAGEIAIAPNDSSIALISGRRLERYSLDRLGIDGLTSVAATPHGFLLVTARGLVRLQGGKARKLDSDLYPWTRKILTVVPSRRGETWLQGDEGISRVAASDLDRAFDSPGAPLKRRLFDFRDGVVGQPQGVNITSLRSTEGGDGRIWFASSAGLLGIDPTRLSESSAPPNVVIRSLTTLTESHRDPSNALTLPPGTRSLRLVYTAMGLSDPDRVQLRYRLEGVDPDWVDPGTRRAISYSNLRPGTYHFRVIAGSASGAWNAQGASLEFRIRPLFRESWPFKLLCVLVAILLIWCVYVLRVRAMATQIRERLAERHDERERIARELHDTLVQSVQGLILRFQLGTDRLPPETPGRKELEQTLLRAEQILADGRDRLRDLRRATSDTLEPAILKAAQDRGFTPSENLFIATSGAPRPVNAAAVNEIVRITEEALFNVARHARATRVDIVIEYRAQMLQLTIRDNGVGIDPAILREGRRDGHFGLIGMRERIRRLKGDMMLDTASEGGAEIILMVPAALAYERPLPWWRNPFWNGLRR